ncbi:ATP-binding cassette long-chain fatty acid transporter pxa1 [Blastocladiella emersonii ATCC 22665]|nr:ATP-binding cassette long-chain fatty acid transporter pxa1 [Blastocladiella emersonii ATCC 22665]
MSAVTNPASLLFGGSPAAHRALKGVSGAALASAVLYALRQTMKSQRRPANASASASKPPADSVDPNAPEMAARFATLPPPGHRVAVNGEFFRQLRAVLTVCIPGLRSKEVLLLALQTAFLLLRTYLSVVVARIDGRIVRDLVAANGKEFLRGLGYWFAIALPATYTNAMIRYLQSKISIALRTRLMRYVNALYLDKNQAYYRLLNLDNRIESPDQYIVTDVARFCDGFANMISSVGKPLIDLIIFNVQLANHIGWIGMTGLFVNYVITARLLRAVTPAFGRLAATEAKLEGDFRTAHTRLTLNAEEICFYNGEAREHSLLNDAYLRLVKHVNTIYKARIGYETVEGLIIKYGWSMVGMGVSALPVFLPEYAGQGSRRRSASSSPATTAASSVSEDADATATNIGSISAVDAMLHGSSNMPEAPASSSSVAPRAARDHTQSFITNKRLLLSLADAGGRIMFSLKEAAELAGYTSRVYSLLSVLHGVHNAEYPAASDPSIEHSLAAVHGTVTSVAEPTLRLQDVDVVVPNPNGGAGTPLVEGLSLELKRGDHLLIQGGNGRGKTSIARLVRGLWPLYEGTLTKPRDEDIFYIPQRPYLVLGTLRDQVIYPDSVDQMRAKGVTDADLVRILELVHLAYLPGREGGWDTVKDGGEKQRLNMARVFYHRRPFCIIDEGTSAVSPDVEGLMYASAKEMGITLITISHRPALAKYHRMVLKIKDDGSYEVTQTGTAEEAMSLEAEIKALEERIRDLPRHKQRLEEVNVELGLSAH